MNLSELEISVIFGKKIVVIIIKSGKYLLSPSVRRFFSRSNILHRPFPILFLCHALLLILLSWTRKTIDVQ
jgi:hypothetical protein